MSTELIETNSDIQLVGLSKPVLEFAPACLARRDIALREAAEVLSVKDEEEQRLAIEAMSSLKSLQKGIESSRELVKRPVLEISRMIDSTAKEFVVDINHHLNRLSVLVSDFQKKERARVEKEKQEQEAIRRKALEEAASRQRELEAKAASAKTAGAKLKALQAMEANEVKLEETIRETVKVDNATKPARVAGMRVVARWKFEVLDIKELAAAKPDWVIIEPNTRVINAMIAGGRMKDCPGLRIYEDVTTGVAP